MNCIASRDVVLVLGSNAGILVAFQVVVVASNLKGNTSATLV